MQPKPLVSSQGILCKPHAHVCGEFFLKEDLFFLFFSLKAIKEVSLDSPCRKGDEACRRRKLFCSLVKLVAGRFSTLTGHKKATQHYHKHTLRQKFALVFHSCKSKNTNFKEVHNKKLHQRIM